MNGDMPAGGGTSILTGGMSKPDLERDADLDPSPDSEPRSGSPGGAARSTKPCADADPPETPVISAIEPTKRDARRWMVRVGRTVKATLQEKRVRELGLEVGQPWSEALAAKVAEAARYDTAMRQAMDRLSRRAMSRSRLLSKLQEKGHDAAVLERVASRLQALGLLDDEAFARSFVRQQLGRQPAGPALLRAKLRRQGVDDSVAERVVQQATQDPDSQRQAALSLARKRYASLRRFDSATRRRRLFGQLARRGFDSDLIREIMETLDHEAARDEDENESIE